MRKRGGSLNSNSMVFKNVFFPLESTRSSENKKQKRFVCWRGNFTAWLDLLHQRSSTARHKGTMVFV